MSPMVSTGCSGTGGGGGGCVTSPPGELAEPSAFALSVIAALRIAPLLAHGIRHACEALVRCSPRESGADRKPAPETACTRVVRLRCERVRRSPPARTRYPGSRDVR